MSDANTTELNFKQLRQMVDELEDTVEKFEGEPVDRKVRQLRGALDHIQQKHGSDQNAKSTNE